MYRYTHILTIEYYENILLEFLWLFKNISRLLTNQLLNHVDLKLKHDYMIIYNTYKCLKDISYVILYVLTKYPR